jgi:hypothetical protein
MTRSSERSTNGRPRSKERPFANWVAGITVSTLLVVAACNAVPIGESDSASGESPVDTSADLPAASKCAGYDPPEEGDPCDGNSHPRSCEYGHDLNRQCNDFYECNGHWTRRQPSICFGRCPSAIEAIVVGTACDDVSVGCSYLDGTCACVPDDDAGASDAAPTDAAVMDAAVTDGAVMDAGASDASSGGHWRCAPTPGNGCPAQRPPRDSDCVRPMTCDYGTAVLLRDVTYACVYNVWIQPENHDDP